MKFAILLLLPLWIVLTFWHGQYHSWQEEEMHRMCTEELPAPECPDDIVFRSPGVPYFV